MTHALQYQIQQNLYYQNFYYPNTQFYGTNSSLQTQIVLSTFLTELESEMKNSLVRSPFPPTLTHTHVSDFCQYLRPLISLMQKGCKIWTILSYFNG